MAVSVDSHVLLAGRGSRGVFMKDGPPSFATYTKFTRNESKACRVFSFSQDGSLFAWCNGQSLKIVSVPECMLVQEISSSRTSYVHFSPQGTLIATWELFTIKKDDPVEGAFNLHIYEVCSGKCVKSFVQKRQVGWEPQWSANESIVARGVNSEVHLYEKNDFETVTKKMSTQKISDFRLSSGLKGACYVACYAHGVKGQPSNVRIYKYPNVDGLSTVIANKSFFKGDKVDLKWNERGSALLVTVSTETDKTGASYYGEQALNLLTTSGDSCAIKLGKEGPIYSVEWSPQNDEFCVVYGFMPAKATLFNLKGDPTFDFGSSPRNLVYYNPFGNILLLAGFGNLNGTMELWDLKKKKEICRTQARDSTHLQWCPDGTHFVTATLAPRLRIGNGYRVWHYTGSLVHEHRCESDEELWQLHWRPFPKGTFKKFPIIYVPVPSIEPAQPEASKEVYKPPAARGLPGANFKVHEELEKPSNHNKEETPVSNRILRNKAKSEARLAKKKAERDGSQPLNEAERSRSIRALMKKLEQIHKLQEMQTSGKKLDLKQLEKIDKESEVLRQLQALQVQ